MNNFLKLLKTLFAPPVFDDREKTTKAYLLNFITLALFSVSMLVILLAFFAAESFEETMDIVLSRGTPVLIILIISQTLMRTGRVREASWFFAISHWISETYGMYVTGGAASVSLSNYMLSVLIFGLLLGSRQALLTAGASFISALVMVNLNLRGALPESIYPADQQALTAILVFIILIFLGTTLLYLFLRGQNETLEQLRMSNLALEEAGANLERRVAERTRALSSVAEVGAAVSTILETDKLLQLVVDLAKERFNFYHAHIYLLNEAGNELVLSSGAGEIGRQMVAEGRSINLDHGHSLVARAAREKKGITVNDVTTSPDFLPHPLLPDTRSEMAVPMMVGERVIGVFDVQSEAVGRFTDADIAVQTTLASQVGSAVQNAHSYTETQRSQALLSDALKAARLGNWEYDFEKDLFHFSDEFYSIFRTSVEKVGGYKISSADYARNFVHPDDAALVGSEIQKVLEAKDRHFTTHLEHRIIFSDGEIGYIAVNINVERDENGNITRWYGANQDITERRRLEEINRKRAFQQEKLNLITQQIQSADTVESALQITARELGRALGQKPTLVTLDAAGLTNGDK